MSDAVHLGFELQDPPPHPTRHRMKTSSRALNGIGAMMEEMMRSQGTESFSFA